MGLLTFMGLSPGIVVPSDGERPQPADDARMSLSSRHTTGGLLGMARALRRGVQSEDVRAGTVLVREGDSTDTLYLLVEGTVEVVLGHGTDARVVARLGRGALIGETALLTGAVSSTTVRAETDVRAYRIDQAAFLAAAEAEPAIFRELARELALRLRSADSVIMHDRRQRIVGLCHESAHATSVDAILSACARWSDVSPLTIDLRSTSAATRSVREYMDDTRTVTSLATELIATSSVTLSAHDVPADDLPRFIGSVEEFARLVIVSGDDVPASLAGAISETVTLTADVRAKKPRHQTGGGPRLVEVAVGARFDAERVARRICERQIGLALGGGGARGLAHIGVMRALRSAQIPIDYVTGTSIGAAVGAGVASGMTVEAISSSIEATGRRALLPSVPPLYGLFNGAFIEGELRRQFGAKNIEDLGLELGLLSTDLLSGEEMLFTSGPVVPALMASMAIPGIFAPVRHEGRLLADGALRSPVPVRACRKMGADVVIASQMRVAAGSGSGRGRPMPWIPETILWALDVMQDHITSENIESADVSIETILPRERAGMFDFGHRREIEEAGERAAHDALAVREGLVRAARAAVA